MTDQNLERVIDMATEAIMKANALTRENADLTEELTKLRVENARLQVELTNVTRSLEQHREAMHSAIDSSNYWKDKAEGR